MMDALPYVPVAVTAESERHWQDLALGRLSVPWCAICDHHVWLPKWICPDCLTEVEEWRTLSGEGEVYTFSIIHKGEQEFADVVPYVLAYISVDGGPTMLGNIVGEDALDVSIGDRVRLTVPETSVTVGAPRFQRVGD